MRKVVNKKVLRLLRVGVIYPMQDSDLVMLVQLVPKKGAITSEERADLRGKSTMMCIDCRMLNKATRIDHLSLSPPSLVICLKWLANHSFFHYLDIYSGYQHSPIHEDNRVKLPSPVPTVHFAYWRMSFGLCNAPALPQRCMMVAFSDPIENIMKDFSVCGNTLRC